MNAAPDVEQVGSAVGIEGEDPSERSLIDDLRLLAADGRTLAEAEIAYQKSRASVFGAGIGKIAALGVLALLLLSLALVALVVGLLLALTPILSAWGATAAIAGVLLVFTAVMTLWARSRWLRLSRLVGEEPPE